MRVVIGLRRVAHAPQRLNHVRLWIALPRIDDVIDGLRTAKMRMVRLTGLRRDPALMVRIREEFFVAKIAAQQAKLPEVICNILADVRDHECWISAETG